MISSAVPSMFHRRLLLLCGAIVVGMAVVAGQAARLTIARRAELLERAESKLVARNWTPTVRGRILDRKGRVLAEDAPSYDLAMSFQVINGRWAAARAREQASRKFKRSWDDWSRAEREAAVERLEAVYAEHQKEAWTRLATVLGSSVDDIDARRRELVAKIQRRYDAVVAMRRARELARAQAPGADPLSEADLQAIERRATEPIWEQGATHTLVPRISDTIARALDRYAGLEVELTLAPADPATGEAVVDNVELIPGLRIINSGDRLYPLETMPVAVDRSHFPGPLRSDTPTNLEVGGVASHILGWMREGVQDEDVATRRELISRDPELRDRVYSENGRDRGFYDPETLERVGASGVEQSMEAQLRGLRGERVRQLDTGAIRLIDAAPGRDVSLSLDIQLQARIQAAMDPQVGLARVQPWNQSPETVVGSDGQRKPNPAYRAVGTPLYGAAVVLDIDSGEVLSMVSTPSFLRSELAIEGSKVFDLAAGGAYINRAIGRPYPPGSVAKALILNGAAQRGAYKLGETIECNGHLFPNQENAFRCWIFKMSQLTTRTTHTAQLGHALRGAEGLMVSCNVFFFTLGQRLGLEGIEATYREFGVGTPFRLGIGPEYAGSVGGPTPAGKFNIQDAIQMGIGQGPVAWTPMHAANAYATLARMGVSVKPRIILGGPTPEPQRIGLVQEVAAEALEGLGLSVNAELGSGHHFTINGREKTFDLDPTRIWIWGKTGTAAGSDTIDPDGKGGPLPPETVAGDHSWFTILVGPASERRPRFAVSVLMEYAGSGGKVSGPICNQIVHALIAEGYLPSLTSDPAEANPASRHAAEPGGGA